MFKDETVEIKKEIEITEQKPSEKRIYTVKEIQNILDVSRPTAYELIKKNLFHSVRIGGRIRISKKSFDTWFYGQE